MRLGGVLLDLAQPVDDAAEDAGARALMLGVLPRVGGGAAGAPERAAWRGAALLEPLSGLRELGHERLDLVPRKLDHVVVVPRLLVAQRQHDDAVLDGQPQRGAGDEHALVDGARRQVRSPRTPGGRAGGFGRRHGVLA